MGIKYVSGKTRELKVGLSSYSEGKPSLQVTGNVGVGTTNPLKKANPANTSVVSSGIVTAYQIFAQIYSGSDAGTGAAGEFDRQANIAIGDTFTGNTGIVSNYKYANISIGNCAGKSLFGGAQKNVIIGDNAGVGIADGSKNVVIGDNALGKSGISGDENFAVGDAAGYNLTSGSHNIMFGDQTGGFTSTGGCNIFMGRRAGMQNQDGNFNIILGNFAGYSNGNGSDNIFLGTCAMGACLNPSNTLVIGHYNHQWIHGDSNYSIGIGITNPSVASVAIGNTQKLAAGIVTAYTIFSDQLNVTGIATINTLDSLNISGVSTFAGISTFYNTVNFDGASNFNDNVFVGTGATVGFGTTAFFPDNAAVYFGDSEDLKVYHDGSHSYIDDKGTGNLKLRSNNFRISNADESKLYAAFQAGAAELYHDNNLRLTSTASGIDVTDTLHVAGITTFAGISTFVGITTFASTTNFASINATGGSFTGNLQFANNVGSLYGTSNHFQIYATGNDSIIEHGGTGVLNIFAGNYGDKAIRAYRQAQVEIYHNNAERLRTTGIGISVAGIGSTAYIEGPENIIIDPHPYGVGTTSGNVFIRGDLYVEGTEFIVDVDKIELGDFQIGIATTAGTNVLLDGAGIGIGSTNIRKFITWNNATNALMTSENWNLASGKHYEINGTDVLTSDTLLVGTGASVHSPSNNILTLHTNGAEKLRIDASGNLGIGTAVPTDSANAANASVTSAGIVTAVEYYGVFKGSIPGFSTVFSSSSGSFSATPGTPQIIDTFAFSTHDYQIAEYTLHFVHANGIQAQKALVMQDNSVAYSNEYGVMYDSELLVSIAATVSSGNVNITATPEAGISGVTTFRWRREVQT